MYRNIVHFAVIAGTTFCLCLLQKPVLLSPGAGQFGEPGSANETSASSVAITLKIKIKPHNTLTGTPVVPLKEPLNWPQRKPDGTLRGTLYSVKGTLHYPLMEARE